MNAKDNIVSIYIDKSIIGNSFFVKQIAIIHSRNNKYKFSVRYIKNPYKQSVNAIELKEALSNLFEILKKKEIIIFNENGFDYSFLKDSYKEHFNCQLNNVIYDVSLGAKKMDINKFNLLNLARIFDCSFQNNKNLPKSVYKAQMLYLIGLRMFSL